MNFYIFCSSWICDMLDCDDVGQDVPSVSRNLLLWLKSSMSKYTLKSNDILSKVKSASFYDNVPQIDENGNNEKED